MYQEETEALALFLEKNDGKVIKKWFDDTLPSIIDIYHDLPDSYLKWLSIIRDLSGINWELFIQILAESAEILQKISLAEYEKWLRLARTFTKIDVKIALTVAKLGKAQITSLETARQEKYLDNCQELFTINWEVSLAYFKNFPKFVEGIRNEEIECWNNIIFKTSKKSPLLVKEFLNGVVFLCKDFSQLEIETWLNNGLELEGKVASSKIAQEYLKYYSQVAQLSYEDKHSFLENWTMIVFKLSQIEKEATIHFMKNSPQVLSVLSKQEDFLRWVSLGEKVSLRSSEAAIEY